MIFEPYWWFWGIMWADKVLMTSNMVPYSLIMFKNHTSGPIFLFRFFRHPDHCQAPISYFWVALSQIRNVQVYYTVLLKPPVRQAVCSVIYIDVFLPSTLICAVTGNSSAADKYHGTRQNRTTVRQHNKWGSTSCVKMQRLQTRGMVLLRLQHQRGLTLL